MKKFYHFIHLSFFVSILLLGSSLQGATSLVDESYTTYEQTRTIESGSTYVFAMAGIKPNNGSTGQYGLLTSAPVGASVNLAFREFLAQDRESADNLMWIIEEYQEGYSIKAVGIEGEQSYLNITSGTVILGAKQAIAITFDGDNFLRISKDFSGTPYYVRFTNSFKVSGVNTSCFVAGTNSVSSDFKLYKVNNDDHPDPLAPCDSPIYTIVATSDLHTDYGLQEASPFVRNGVITTMDRIKKEENANILLLGGDLTSHNATSYTWTKEIHTRAMEQIYTLGRSATASGRVLYATGNHDFAAGGASYNSGDYVPVMKADIGEFVDSYYQEGSPHSHVLGYHYVIDGLDFVVINTAYIGEDNHSNYLYEQKLIDWLDVTLSKINSDKTVFVMGHYPLRDSRNISSAGKGVSNTNDCNNNLKGVFLKHKNVIYLYGHDHGGYVPKNDTFERITPYSNLGAVIDNKNSIPSGFVSAFMGSMSYYTGSLSASQPTVVQALVIYICNDRITFQMKNYGVSHAGSPILSSYSIPREAIISSLTETEERAKPSLFKIYPNPAKNTLNVELSENRISIKIKNAFGKVVKKMDSASDLERIDISELVAGIYFVEGQSQTSSEVAKLIIE